MIFRFSYHQRFVTHVPRTRESHGVLMHAKQQSVRTIYRHHTCFRNDDNDLRISVAVNWGVDGVPDM